MLSTQTCPGPQSEFRWEASAAIVADPNFRVVVDGRQAIRTGGVVVASEALEFCVDDLREGRGGGRQIEDVDRLIAAVSQVVLVEHRIDPADVERKERRLNH